MVKGRGTYAINKAMVCDSYDMVRQVQGPLTFSSGEYMPGYSWAEVTLSGDKGIILRRESWDGLL